VAFTFDSSSLFSAIKKPLVWVSIILALILIGAIVLERVMHDAAKNKILRNQAALIQTFKNAPVRIDTVHDTIHWSGKIIIKPIPVTSSTYQPINSSTNISTFQPVNPLPVPTYNPSNQSPNDSIPVSSQLSWYDSVFNHGDIRFRWQAKGDLQFISFSDFVWPKEIITITRQVDTCITKPSPKQPVFRIGPYVGLSLNSFTKFPGFEAGAQLIIKDQLTVSAGGLYLDAIYGNLRLGWLFK
jgi:hypothetical protein